MTAADVESAARAIGDAVVRTPMQYSETLSAICGVDVVVKFENLQFTATYKERGARNRLLALSDAERANGVVAMSAGNHAQGVAHHAQLLGIPATIVMPLDAPITKVVRTEEMGATVVLAGQSLDEAADHAHRLEAEEGRTFIPPYDDPLVIAGQGTVGLEMLEQDPALDTIVVSVGGGGLAAGICAWCAERRPDVDVIGVQADSWPSMYAALKDKQLAAGGSTVAEGIAVGTPGRLTTAILREHLRDIVLVSEEEIETAISLYLEVEKTVTEGAAAAGLAAAARYADRLAGRRVGLIITGGNIDLRVLSSVIMRGLTRSGRLHSIWVQVDDKPGALGRLTAGVGAAGGNIVELSHRRFFTSAPAKAVEIEMMVETRDDAHCDAIRAALQKIDGVTLSRS